MNCLARVLGCWCLLLLGGLGGLASTGHLSAQPRPLNLPLQTQWTIPTPASTSAPPGRTQAADPLPLLPAPTAPFADPRSSQPSPNAMAGSERLAVGVGDQLFVTVFGQPDMSSEVTVNDNGQITLALIGTLKVRDLTPPAIERLIVQRLKDGEFLRNPQVSVQVRQVRSQMISVLGEVARPGRYPITTRTSVLDAIAIAGGLGPRADRVVTLLRRPPAQGGVAGDDARQEMAIQLDQPRSATLSALTELDTELRHDDVVYVGQQKVFYVYGEVRRPGSYPMEPDLNVMKALSISGGITERGSPRRLRISRTDAQQRTHEIKPDLISPLQAGDVLYVDERIF